MIKFFRKIRQNLLKEGKTIRYFKYAIGEIVLVVIGILIALQINTWNINRILNNEIITVLDNIHNEFIQNKQLIEKPFNDIETSIKAGSTIMQLIGQEKSVIKQHNIDQLLFKFLESGAFRPTQNSLSDLLQSGRLQLIQNENLKASILKWTQQLKSYENVYNRSSKKIDDELVPYLSKHYSMKDIDVYGALKWKNKTILGIDKIQIFTDIEFENIVDDYMYRLTRNKAQLEGLKTTINKIIITTDSNNFNKAEK